ncbi:HIR complex subunit [Conglomerata obtusa]
MKIVETPYFHGRKSKPFPIFSIDYKEPYIASGSINGELKIYKDKEFRSYKDHSGSVLCVRFNSQSFLATAGDDFSVAIYNHDLANGFYKLIKKLTNHESDVSHLLWVKNYLLTSGYDGKINIYEINKFELVKCINTDMMCRGMTIDPQYEYITCQGDDKMLVYDMNYELVTTVTLPFQGRNNESFFARNSWSPDGKYLAVGLAHNNKNNTVEILKRNGFVREFSLIGHVAACEVLAFYPKMIVDGGMVIALGSQDRSISFWSNNNTRPFLLLKNVFNQPILDMFWNDNSLYACSYDGQVKIFQFEEHEFGQVLDENVMHKKEGIKIPHSLLNIQIQENGIESIFTDEEKSLFKSITVDEYKNIVESNIFEQSNLNNKYSTLSKNNDGFNKTNNICNTSNYDSLFLSKSCEVKELNQIDNLDSKPVEEFTSYKLHPDLLSFDLKNDNDHSQHKNPSLAFQKEDEAKNKQKITTKNCLNVIDTTRENNKLKDACDREIKNDKSKNVIDRETENDNSKNDINRETENNKMKSIIDSTKANTKLNKVFDQKNKLEPKKRIKPILIEPLKEENNIFKDSKREVFAIFNFQNKNNNLNLPTINDDFRYVIKEYTIQITNENKGKITIYRGTKEYYKLFYDRISLFSGNKYCLCFVIKKEENDSIIIHELETGNLLFPIISISSIIAIDLLNYDLLIVKGDASFQIINLKKCKETLNGILPCNSKLMNIKLDTKFYLLAYFEDDLFFFDRNLKVWYKKNHDFNTILLNDKSENICFDDSDEEDETFNKLEYNFIVREKVKDVNKMIEIVTKMVKITLKMDVLHEVIYNKLNFVFLTLCQYEHKRLVYKFLEEMNTNYILQPFVTDFIELNMTRY